jgi:phage portal protein BeeE
MARKLQARIRARLVTRPAPLQTDVAFAQLLIVTMQIYGNGKPRNGGGRNAN